MHQSHLVSSHHERMHSTEKGAPNSRWRSAVPGSRRTIDKWILPVSGPLRRIDAAYSQIRSHSAAHVRATGS